MNVKVARMSTGEEVIYTLIDESENYIEMENALVAVPNAQGQIGFAPWSFLAEEGETIKVSKEFVVYVINAREMVVDNYKKIFSKIETPSKKLIL